MTTGTITRKPGWWYPWLFVGMFGIVLVVNASLAYFATSSFTGLQTEGAYEKGLAYNKALAEVRAEERLGWSIEPQIDESAVTTGGRLTITAKGRDGRPIDGMDLRVQLIRPTTRGYDMTVRLTAIGDGLYQAAVKLPLPGLWDMRIFAAHGDDHAEILRRVILK